MDVGGGKGDNVTGVNVVSNKGGDNNWDVTEQSPEIEVVVNQDDDGAGGGKPCVGMEFESEDAGKSFYDGYARQLGFSTHVGQFKRAKPDGPIVTWDFACSREVFKRKNIESCNAMFRIEQKDGGKWVATKFVEDHNHSMVTPSKVHYLRPRRHFAGATKNVPETLDATTDVFVSVDGNHVSYEANRVRSASSVEPNRLYQIPFAPFTGINHHGQTVLFGCALLLDESESSFAWLFKTWLSAMNDRPPLSITTDQDRAIQAAVSQVFPETRHCICRWHILREGQERLAHIYLVHPSFYGELYGCINFSEAIEDFESSWSALLDKYDLHKNEWLQAVYNARKQWAPVYFRGIETLTTRFNSLCQEAFKLAEEGAVAPETYNTAISALREAGKRIAFVKKNVVKVTLPSSHNSGNSHEEGSKKITSPVSDIVPSLWPWQDAVSPRFNLNDVGAPLADLNQPSMVPVSIHRDSGHPDSTVVLTCFKSMTWVIENKNAMEAGKVAVINLKLHDYGKNPSGETEVQFRLTRITLEPMLRSMAYISQQLSTPVNRVAVINLKV
ncbi:hypothetical protein QUC31_006093 [Theobroma cacao]